MLHNSNFSAGQSFTQDLDKLNGLLFDARFTRGLGQIAMMISLFLSLSTLLIGGAFLAGALATGFSKAVFLGACAVSGAAVYFPSLVGQRPCYLDLKTLKVLAADSTNTAKFSALWLQEGDFIEKATSTKPTPSHLNRMWKAMGLIDNPLDPIESPRTAVLRNAWLPVLAVLAIVLGIGVAIVSANPLLAIISGVGFLAAVGYGVSVYKQYALKKQIRGLEDKLLADVVVSRAQKVGIDLDSVRVHALSRRELCELVVKAPEPLLALSDVTDSGISAEPLMANRTTYHPTGYGNAQDKLLETTSLPDGVIPAPSSPRIARFFPW